jgi:hypothetical protein
VTFWAGCGAIRKRTFEELGGFDRAWESIEDIELGVRLRARVDASCSTTRCR